MKRNLVVKSPASQEARQRKKIIPGMGKQKFPLNGAKYWRLHNVALVKSDISS